MNRVNLLELVRVQIFYEASDGYLRHTFAEVPASLSAALRQSGIEDGWAAYIPEGARFRYAVRA